jgi:hypothetical protein
VGQASGGRALFFVGRRALERAEAPTPAGRPDDPITYAGRVLTGPEAAYVRAAQGAAIRQRGGDPNITPDQRIADLAYQIARTGIGFEWVDWTLDQLDLYLDGRAARIESVQEQVELALERAKQEKKETLVRFVVPVE